jgi:hypothetical protein
MKRLLWRAGDKIQYDKALQMVGRYEKRLPNHVRAI